MAFQLKQIANELYVEGIDDLKQYMYSLGFKVYETDTIWTSHQSERDKRRCISFYQYAGPLGERGLLVELAYRGHHGELETKWNLYSIMNRISKSRTDLAIHDFSRSIRKVMGEVLVDDGPWMVEIVTGKQLFS